MRRAGSRSRLVQVPSSTQIRPASCFFERLMADVGVLLLGERGGGGGGWQLNSPPLHGACQ